MKFAIFTFLAVFAISPSFFVRGSESASDCATAVETLRAGLEVHPDQAVVLFQDSLQTNPDCRIDLLMAALDTLGDDAESVIPILYAARLEFPDDDTLFAGVVLETLPGLAGELRAAFGASPEEMLTSLAAASPVETTGVETAGGSPGEVTGGTVTDEGVGMNRIVEDAPSSPELAAESAAMDEQIRDAIARVTAKASGRVWPEQEVAGDPVHFKKPDEVRIPRRSRQADESSLLNHLPLDRTDEREIAPGVVKIDDAWRPSGELRLDEAKFAKDGREGVTAPLEAKTKEMAPAGSVGLPKRPPLPRSSVYRIPPAAGSYESTIDLESGESAPPALIIRPESASPTTPR